MRSTVSQWTFRGTGSALVNALLLCAFGATAQGCGADGKGGTGTTTSGATGGSAGHAGAGAGGDAGERATGGNGGNGGSGNQPPEPSCAWLHGYEWSEGSEFSSVDVDAAENAYVSGETAQDVNFGGGALDPTGGFVVSFDAEGEHRFTRSLAGSDAPQLVADDDGNTYFTGSFRDTLTIGTETLGGAVEGEDYGYLASLDPNGDHRWSLVFSPTRAGLDGLFLRLGPDGRLYLITVALAEALTFGGEEYVTTDTGRDLLVIVLDTDGNVETHFMIGGPDDEHLRAATLGPDGNIYVYGAFGDTADLGGEPLVSTDDSTTYLASFERDGTHLWSYSLDNTRTLPVPLAVGDAVYLGIGAGGVAYDLAGNELWTGAADEVSAIEPHPFGGVYFTGFESRPSPQYDSLTLTRLDADGNALETYSRSVVLVTASASAAIRALAARGNSVWLVADGDDAFPGLTEDFQATGMVCRLDELGD